MLACVPEGALEQGEPLARTGGGVVGRTFSALEVRRVVWACSPPEQWALGELPPAGPGREELGRASWEMGDYVFSSVETGWPWEVLRSSTESENPLKSQALP